MKPGKGKRFYPTLLTFPVLLIPEACEGVFYTVLLTFPELLIPEALDREEILHHISHLSCTPDL